MGSQLFTLPPPPNGTFRDGIPWLPYFREPPQQCLDILWMDAIRYHFETMGNPCLLVFTRESSFQVVLGLVAKPGLRFAEQKATNFGTRFLPRSIGAREGGVSGVSPTGEVFCPS